MTSVGFLGTADFFAVDTFSRPVEWINPAWPERISEVRWKLLTMTAAGCKEVERLRLACACETLLVPGDCGEDVLRLVRAERVVSYGISGRDSLTFSSIGAEQRLLCIQRCLLRLDGGALEPQEILLPKCWQSLPDEAVLAWMGTRLLLGEGNLLKTGDKKQDSDADFIDRM